VAISAALKQARNGTFASGVGDNTVCPLRAGHQLLHALVWRHLSRLRDKRALLDDGLGRLTDPDRAAYTVLLVWSIQGVGTNLYTEVRGGTLRKAATLSLLAVLGVLLWATTPAHATFAGANGKIAFIGDDCRPTTCVASLFLVNPDGTDRTMLTHGLQLDGNSKLSWSPDGKTIAFAAEPNHPFCCVQIYVIRANGTGLTQLTDGPGSSLSPSWSPDGRLIAFMNDRDGPGEIFSMTANGGDVMRVGSVIGGQPAWSPNGRRIAFTGADPSGFCCDIYTMRTDGTDVTDLNNTANVDDVDPDWSPDSSQIAFEADPGGNAGVFAMSADGTSKRAVFQSIASDAEPSWSPDGTKIAFVSELGTPGTFELYAIAAPGSGSPVDLTNDAAHPAWQPVAAFKNASKECKVFPGDHRSHGQCVRANR
jgi:WD40 repeat protein